MNVSARKKRWVLCVAPAALVLELGSSGWVFSPLIWAEIYWSMRTAISGYLAEQFLITKILSSTACGVTGQSHSKKFSSILSIVIHWFSPGSTKTKIYSI